MSITIRHHPVEDIRFSNELWASKSLDLIWLPDGVYSNPCLLPTASSSDGVGGTSLNSALRWHWRVDLMFGAWVARAHESASSRNLSICAYDLEASSIVRAYIEESRISAWDECKRIATAGAVRLPDETIYETLDLIRLGVFPAWDGWESLWAKVYGIAEDSASPDVPRPPAAKKQTRYPRVRHNDGATLF